MELVNSTREYNVTLDDIKTMVANKLDVHESKVNVEYVLADTAGTYDSFTRYEVSRVKVTVTA